MEACPICDQELNALVCDRCGYDASVDYEQYVTVVPVPPQAKSRAAQREAWQRRQAPPDALRCAKCGGVRFLFSMGKRQLICSGCRTAVGVEAAIEASAQEALGKVTQSLQGLLQECMAASQLLSGAQTDQGPSDAGETTARRLPTVAIIGGWIAAIKEDGTVEATTRAFGTQQWENIISLAVGYDYLVGCTDKGRVLAAGGNSAGQCEVHDWRDICAVAVGSFHTVGLKTDGTVLTTGSNDYGQRDVDDWTQMRAIAAGSYHTVGLRADGTVAATGKNTVKQCDVAKWTQVTALAAGTLHTVGLRADGTVLATGDNTLGQCRCSGWNHIVAVAAGTWHTVGLREDGTVVAVGSNRRGQCEVQEWSGIVAIAAGGCYTVGLRPNGTALIAGPDDDTKSFVKSWRGLMVPSTD